MNLNFKNRIILFNTTAAALSTFVAFVAVYGMVYTAVYRHMDNILIQEKEEIKHLIDLAGSRILLKEEAEWHEQEHTDGEAYPMYLQIADRKGGIIYQSENLNSFKLTIILLVKTDQFSNTKRNQEGLRQGQFPLEGEAGKILGYLTVAIPRGTYELVLRNLLFTLILAFPLLVFIVWRASAFAARRGIAPVNQLIKAARGIDEQHLGARMPLPPNQDEIYQLATTINELLVRLENSFQREKQITSDLSHEMRTPLTAIRGALEVLIRKRRDPEHYEQKIRQIIGETDRMSRLFDQLLQLSRAESGAVQPMATVFFLIPFVEEILVKWAPALAEKQIEIQLNLSTEEEITADQILLETILDNLLGNALKYSPPGGKIYINWNNNTKTLSIEDEGPGIALDHQAQLFDRFYRADPSRNAQEKGVGLGLAIAKKLADLQKIHLILESIPGQRTRFMVRFPNKAWN